MTHETIRERVAEAVLEDVGDEIDHLALVAGADVAAREGDRLLREAVANARRAGHSWDAVGRVLGVSRQAAQQRFAAPSAGAAGTADARGTEPARRVLTGVTAFTEMGVLEVEGAPGWHLVDFGPL